MRTELLAKKPDWLVLIEAWKSMGMGAYGPTVPFVTGALGHRFGTKPKDASEVIALLDAMASFRVPGQFIYVTWCPTIEAPVLSLRRNLTQQWADWSHEPITEHAPLEFGPQICSTAGLSCTDTADCIRKLAEDAWEPIQRGTFSRNRDYSGNCAYGAFTPHEIRFIEHVLGR